MNTDSMVRRCDWFWLQTDAHTYSLRYTECHWVDLDTYKHPNDTLMDTYKETLPNKNFLDTIPNYDETTNGDTT